MDQLEKAILRTLAYADIFDYPLTAEEIYRFLIGQEKERKTQDEIKTQLVKNSYLLSRISYHNGFYCLKERKQVVAIRKKRERWSQKKLRIARRVASWLRLISWIKMVAVTGALAMKNSAEDDDVDLFLVTAENRLWLSRGIVATFLRFLGLYRRPDKVENMICPNMLLDEEHLMVPKKEQDLFSAHEVCQLKAIWDRNGTYQRFIKENQWVKQFLPNWKP